MTIYARPIQKLTGKAVQVFCGIALIIASSVAYANKPENITETEMRLIPEYCPDTMGFRYGDATNNTSPRANHWVSIMGHGFWAMHHYCWGQINLMRAQRVGMPGQQKRELLKTVRSDFQYSLYHTPEEFILRPEMLTRLGQVELMLFNPNAADKAFVAARKLMPDYWPAYTHWIEFLIRKGKKAEAKELAKTGLEYSPNSKVLIAQYKLLGGNPSKIEPKSKPSESTAASPDDRSPENKTGDDPSPSQNTGTK